jgi:asparagine synthase (glutamine-hydrolysing)
MCGIVGIASLAPVLERGWLTNASGSMAHRGPDDSGLWWSADGRVGLAHRRLSIIDLTPAGRQPMHDAAEVIHVIFNGEIYNFQELRQELARAGFVFRSRTDTEVIIAAYLEWGPEFLSRFNGMFAIALHDARRQQVVLARDRAGEKPIYYRKDTISLRFASELKAIMAEPGSPRSLNHAALDCYLALGFVPGEHCLLAGVSKLPPAHALVFDLASGESRVWRYWTPPEPSRRRGNETELLEELEALFQGAVRKQLVSDVPVGVLLSGGMDSSLVTAMAVRATSHIRTFTVTFPGAGKYDEAKHARLIARHFGTEHSELEAESTRVDILSVLARQFDDPIIDSSIVPTYLVTQLIRRHCTVALGGDGGDELFGGYSYYDRLLRLQRFASRLPAPVIDLAARAARNFLPLGFRGRNWAMALGADLGIELPLLGPFFDCQSRKRLLSCHPEWPFEGERIWAHRTPRTEDLLDRATRMDFHNYLPEDILVKVDRASMLNSLEVRAPMLDVGVMEFALGKVPPHLKATTKSRKVLLRRLAARVLPPAFQTARKQGFSIPLDSWLRSGSWFNYFRDVLLDREQRFFDHGFITKLLKAQQRGLFHGERLFGLVMFELWRREYKIAL